ncbi:MAG TPA: rhombosortase [Thiothrix sp.]|nr:rhombosortase [Thiothrix sp.]
MSRFIHPLFPLSSPVFFASLALMLLLLLLQTVQPELLFQRERIDAGEWWRIWTGSLVHTNYVHYALNMLGLLLLLLLFQALISIRVAFFGLFVLITGVGLGLYFFSPDLMWYAGLSSALYGGYVIASVYAIAQRDYSLGIPVLLVIMGKFFWNELNPDSLDDSLTLIGAIIAQDAHRYGIITAIVYLLIHAVWRMIQHRLSYRTNRITSVHR